MNSSKFEARNSKQYQMIKGSNVSNNLDSSLRFRFSYLNFEIVSDFGIRVSDF
jgi:hypothetical protein